MSIALQMRFETQAQGEKAFPRKMRCSFTQRGVHYFIANAANEIFCSKECRKADERDRPGQ